MFLFYQSKILILLIIFFISVTQLFYAIIKPNGLDFARYFLSLTFNLLVFLIKYNLFMLSLLRSILPLMNAQFLFLFNRFCPFKEHFQMVSPKFVTIQWNLNQLFFLKIANILSKFLLALDLYFQKLISNFQPK